MKNVLYVPKLGQNLFSISAAANNGLTHIGSKDELIFYFNKIILFRAYSRDKLYLIIILTG